MENSGVIKFYNDKRGFGFITYNGSEDMFFHVSNVLNSEKDLTEGTAVCFDVDSSMERPKAINVQVGE